MMTIEEVLDNIAATRGVCGDNPFMLTASGRALDLVDPKPEQIQLDDMAHHLARIARFTGAINRDSYSVGQHLLLSTAIAQQVLNDEESVNRQSSEYFDQLLAVALHDGEEYAVNDLSSPMKAAIAPSKYKEVAVHLRETVYRAFDVDWTYHNSLVQLADLNALVTERYILLPPSKHWPRVRPDQLFCRELPEMSTTEVEQSYKSLITELLWQRDRFRKQEYLDALPVDRAAS